MVSNLTLTYHVNVHPLAAYVFHNKNFVSLVTPFGFLYLEKIRTFHHLPLLNNHGFFVL